MKRTLVRFALILSVLFASACQKEPWRPGQALAKDQIRICAIYPNEISPESSYDYMHYLGLQKMRTTLGLSDNQLVQKTNVFEARPGEVEAAMRECIAGGANLVLALSWANGEVCENLADEFPNVIFAHATGTRYNTTNFTHYSGRIYQARYLSGIAAGLQTKTGKIGFVAAMGKNNSEVTGGINAFALGVERVNPQARVFVKVTHSWFDPMGETDAARALIASGSDVIAMHCNTANPVIAAEKVGVLGIGYNSDMSTVAPRTVMTSVVFDWSVYYIRLIQSLMDGSFTTAPYFGSLKEGMVDLTSLNEALVVPGTVETVSAARRYITEGGFNVFDGVMETNDGRTVGHAGRSLSDTEITGDMNWYYRTVIEEK